MGAALFYVRIASNGMGEWTARLHQGEIRSTQLECIIGRIKMSDQYLYAKQGDQDRELD